ncbi:hypothetical protein LIER_33258 [Lithospermum erythrorhizon]|uniref:Uncharacterized protein n=1 Tax=Lithospermum erythrorhizon TaxID=34254 RepID=A0AAV3RZD4_LITER
MGATLILSSPLKMNLPSNIAFIGLKNFQTPKVHISYPHIINSITQRSSTQFSFKIYGQKEPHELVEDLRVPTQWLDPSKAIQESEWLRVTLHKWLDDEYCPEDTNIEISKVAANSYYRSLVEGETDIGDILLKMASELESISYQDSFHGAFSSANAAVNLIIQRIGQL